MTKTQLPTDSDYEKAIEDLRKLNDDLFYNDFKKTINELSINMEQITFNTSSDFKKESENLVSRTNLLLRQIEVLQIEIDKQLKSQQQSINKENKDFLEIERKQLLFVYNELQEKMQFLTEENKKLQQHFQDNNKNLIDKVLEITSSVDKNMKEFNQDLSIFNERNNKILEQNQAYVTLTKKQLSEFEQRLKNYFSELNQMEKNMEDRLSSFDKQFKEQVKKVENDLVIREEIIINKIAEQHNSLIMKLDENYGVETQEKQKLQGKIESLFINQDKQSKEQLSKIFSNMVNKEELAKVKKRFIYILMPIVIIQTILIIWIGLSI